MDLQLTRKYMRGMNARKLNCHVYSVLSGIRFLSVQALGDVVTWHMCWCSRYIVELVDVHEVDLDLILKNKLNYMYYSVQSL